MGDKQTKRSNSNYPKSFFSDSMIKQHHLVTKLGIVASGQQKELASFLVCAACN